MKNLDVRVGDMVGSRFQVTVAGITALASPEAIRFAISERFQTWCDPVGNISNCDVDHAFTFTVDSEIGSPDESTEAPVEKIIRAVINQLDRAARLALA